MNNTKWNEIFKEFCQLECKNRLIIPWMTKDKISGYEYGWDTSWTHFGCIPAEYERLEWLKIKLTAGNKDLVLSVLRKIHVPGEIMNDNAIIYGYEQSDWI